MPNIKDLLSISVSFKAEPKVSSDLIAWLSNSLYDIMVNRTGRWIWHFWGLVTKLTTFGISASRHGGQFFLAAVVKV